ncbi:hypothetical protein KC321_g74 [Hortaea werneckii]|nr:hypothetical protein KC321_g74 [Hortaea werneckii]
MQLSLRSRGGAPNFLPSQSLVNKQCRQRPQRNVNPRATCDRAFLDDTSTSWLSVNGDALAKCWSSDLNRCHHVDVNGTEVQDKVWAIVSRHPQLSSSDQEHEVERENTLSDLVFSHTSKICTGSVIIRHRGTPNFKATVGEFGNVSIPWYPPAPLNPPEILLAPLTSSSLCRICLHSRTDLLEDDVKYCSRVCAVDSCFVSFAVWPLLHPQPVSVCVSHLWGTPSNPETGSGPHLPHIFTSIVL